MFKKKKEEPLNDNNCPYCKGPVTGYPCPALKLEGDTIPYVCQICAQEFICDSGDVLQHKIREHNYKHEEERTMNYYHQDVPYDRSQPTVTYANRGRGGGNTAHAIKTLLTQPKNQTGLLVVPTYQRIQSVLNHPIIEELGCFAINELSNRHLGTKSGAIINITTTMRRGCLYNLIVIDEFDDFAIKNQYNLKQWVLEAASSEILLTGSSKAWNTCRPPYEPQPFSYERFVNYVPIIKYGDAIKLRDPETSTDLTIERNTSNIRSFDMSVNEEVVHYRAKTDDWDSDLEKDIKLFIQEDLAAL